MKRLPNSPTTKPQWVVRDVTWRFFTGGRIAIVSASVRVCVCVRSIYHPLWGLALKPEAGKATRLMPRSLAGGEDNKQL